MIVLQMRNWSVFVVDHESLIIIFQPYAVGSEADGPFTVKIPFTELIGKWQSGNPIEKHLPLTKNFISSWDRDNWICDVQEDHSIAYVQKGADMDFGDVQIKKSGIGQFEDDFGVFANKNFKKGEVVLKWNLKSLTKEEFEKLPAYEQENFCHRRRGIIYYYPDPERHVNRSNNPNVIPDFEKGANIALRDIRQGEELSISDTSKEDF